MTTQYRSAGTTFHWPSLIYNAEQQQVGRTILRKSLLRLQCGAAKSTPLITYAIKSSRLPRAEENEKSSVDSAKAISGSRVFHQPNTVGIIGGASAPVTADFVKKVVEWSSGETEESLPLLLCSDPQLKQEFHSLLAGIDLGTSGKSVFPDHGGSVLAALMEKRTFLENSGACCIVMPCHVAHAWYPKLLQGCSVPFLHIGDCVARELKEANFRPIETGSNVKIGLLGTEETLNAGFYQDKLSNQGISKFPPHFHGIMTMQYSRAGTALHWPSSICNAEQHQVRRTILRKSLLRLQYGAAKSSPLITSAIKSSILPRADENEKSSEDSTKTISGSRVFHQPNAVGIIGGASAPAMADFVKKVVLWTSGETEESLPLLLCSDPQLKQELRSSLARIDLGTSMKSFTSDHGGSVLATLREKRTFLESSGACCIVMPCHVSHAWYQELSQGCSVPFLHIGDCVAGELKEANLKPIETGSNVKIGLLGTEETLRAGFYQDRLSNQGFEVVLPDQATMEHIVLPAIGALRSKDIEGARILLRIALQILLVRAVSMVVIASYDMRSLLAPDDPLLKKCIDPIDALARATVKWSHSVRNIT